jgi:hypothetical protein
VLSRGDLLEVRLTEARGEAELLAALQAQAVPGLAIESVGAATERRRSLPARMLAADYEIALRGIAAGDVARAMEAVLAASSLPLRVDRGKRVREFDLRPLVLALAMPEDAEARVMARLRHSPEATGRPDDLVSALGFEPSCAEITRIGLVLGP